jgi:hypothetical protein
MKLPSQSKWKNYEVLKKAFPTSFNNPRVYNWTKMKQAVDEYKEQQKERTALIIAWRQQNQLVDENIYLYIENKLKHDQESKNQKTYLQTSVGRY